MGACFTRETEREVVCRCYAPYNTIYRCLASLSPLSLAQALREEQSEAAWMSSTTVGDDEGSVDTLNTADTPKTVDSLHTGRSSTTPRNLSSAPSELESDLTPPSATAQWGSRRAQAVTEAVTGVGAQSSTSGGEVATDDVVPTPPNSIKEIDLRTVSSFELGVVLRVLGWVCMRGKKACFVLGEGGCRAVVFAFCAFCVVLDYLKYVLQ